MPDPDFYQRLEADLEALLGDLPAEWTATERAEVSKMIEVGEYGVALETLAAIAVEANRPLSLDLLHQINMLAERMDLRASAALGALNDHVSAHAVTPVARVAPPRPMP